MREHEEFVWLHDRFVENEDYAGILVCTRNFAYQSMLCVCVCLYMTCVCGSVFECVVMLRSTFQIPAPPPKPDFDEPRAKLTRLREGEESMSKEQYTKMKQELEA